MKNDNNAVSSTLCALSFGPSRHVIKHSGYIINGIHFSTKDRDSRRTTQNSGVSIIAKTLQFSSAKDKNPVFCEVVFYGVVKEIWELDYVSVRIPVFLCDWVDINNGIQVDKNGFTFVDLNRLGHKEEPFIMASQAKQVFYVSNNVEGRSWSHVFPTQPRDYGRYEPNDYTEGNETIVEQLTPIKGLSKNSNEHENLEDNENFVRHDGEGIWIVDT